MSPEADYVVMANQAERDVNSYQSKTGEARPQGLSVQDSGVNSNAERKFHGADVKYGDDLSREQYNAVPRTPVPTPADPSIYTSTGDRTGSGSGSCDVAAQGKEASRANVGDHGSIGGNKFPGSNYFEPESVPGRITSQGWEPPESVLQASSETVQREYRKVHS